MDTNHSILVVDDDEDIRELLILLLERASYRTTCATNGHEALAALESGVFDLVLTDLEMPQYDGQSLCRTIRGDQRYERLPIVVMSARQDLQAVANTLPHVAIAHKPFRTQELLMTIAAQIAARRPEAGARPGTDSRAQLFAPSQ